MAIKYVIIMVCWFFSYLILNHHQLANAHYNQQQQQQQQQMQHQLQNHHRKQQQQQQSSKTFRKSNLSLQKKKVSCQSDSNDIIEPNRPSSSSSLRPETDPQQISNNYQLQQQKYENDSNITESLNNTVFMASTITDNDPEVSTSSSLQHQYDHELDINHDQETLLQRQFNLYRYYVSQYPELFQEYFRQLRQQQQQQQQQEQLQPKKELKLSEQQQQQQSIIVEQQFESPSSSMIKQNDNANQIQQSINQNHDQQQQKIRRDFFVNENVKEKTTTTTTNPCRLLCRCSKCCPTTTTTSDSSWSDQPYQQQRSQHQATSNTLYYLDANHLLEDERYEHLSRVITPPNAFLNNQKISMLNLNDNNNDMKNHQIEIIDGHGFNNYYTNSIDQQQQSLNTIFYSDKRTQTDVEELIQNGLLQTQTQQPQQQQQQSSSTATTTELSYQKIDHLSRRLQRQLSLIDTKSAQQQQQLHHQLSEPLKNHYSQQQQQQQSKQQQKQFDDDHIYYTIRDPNRFSNINDSNVIYSSSTTKQMNKMKNNNNKMILSDKSNIVMVGGQNNVGSGGGGKSFWNRLSHNRSEKQLNKLNVDHHHNGENGKKSEQQQPQQYQQKLKNYIQAMYLDQDKVPDNNNITSDELYQWSLIAGDDLDDDDIDVNKSSMMMVEQQQQHRIATSKNGIPCACERCRESRGMNLTTELLPIDTQIPLQTMDNMDSFFQDSSMAELICMIQ
ncbi:uncharacterized protein LOC124496885 isoform X1 [Dermatophagoides farinae]|uniref:uncharacterized protein LOC124496885 isoform X1 n=2 Tax=Dermatophagoides farinae TaxID=6954 RepID=UPI003F63FC12